jgi:hypothetical protein
MELRKPCGGSDCRLGAALAIGAMEWLSVAPHYPLLVICLATSTVRVIGAPDPAELALAYLAWDW